jgi:hypothetical protein
VVLALLVACGSKKEPAGGSKPADPPKPTATQSFAVAIVIEGSEMWIGNDQVVDEIDPSRDPGALKSLKESFDRVPLKNLPAGSKGTVIAYGEKATVRQPMGPIETVKGASFGEQKDYAGVIDRNLVAGVTLGLDELAKVPDARRILFVIGDGTDENPDAAKAQLAALAKRAETEKVQIVSIVYKGARSRSDSDIAALDPNPTVVNTADTIPDHLAFTFNMLQGPSAPAVAGGPAPPFTLAVLMADQEIWVGNDEYEAPDSPAMHRGALNAIRAAFDKPPFKDFPAGSQAIVLTYDDNTKVTVPSLPLANFDARQLVTQKDAKGKLGTELVAGVRSAFNELTKVGGDRRVLIILGDGNDTNNEAAKAQLQQLAKQAADRHIEVHAIVWKGELSEPSNVITELDPKAKTAATSDELATDLVALLSSLRTK